MTQVKVRLRLHGNHTPKSAAVEALAARGHEAALLELVWVRVGCEAAAGLGGDIGRGAVRAWVEPPVNGGGSGCA